jgi:hypothetical protein
LWSSAVCDRKVAALAALPNGHLVAGGNFFFAGNIGCSNIARWNGSGWSPIGGGTNGFVAALALLPNGDLVAGGSFTSAGGVAANRIARWDGAAWAPLGAGLDAFVSALAVLPNGDLAVGGAFTTAGSVAASRIARWNGASWSALATGANDVVSALHVAPSGQLAAGGLFTVAGGQVSAYVARYATPCPATVVAAGAACASSGGSNTLAAVTLPWAGSVYRTRGTGLPTLAFVARVTGLGTTSLLLGSVLPPSPVGCSLLVTPDLVDAVLTTTGTVDAQLALPNAASLAGLVLHQQFVALQVDALGNLVQNTSTNRLTATVGTF